MGVYLFSDGNIPIWKGVSSQHSRHDIVILWHVHILIESRLRQTTLFNIFKFWSNLKEIEIWVVSAIKPSREKPRIISLDEAKSFSPIVP